MTAPTGDNSRELMIFTLYSKQEILNNYNTLGVGAQAPVGQSITLYVNPTQVDFAQPRIIQKVQTEAYQRFVVQDWGPDLMTLTISGQTGKLLPQGAVFLGYPANFDKSNPSFTDPGKKTKTRANTTTETLQALRDYIYPQKETTQQKPSLWGRISAYANTQQQESPSKIMRSLKYSDIITASHAFHVFQSLYNLYSQFDATSSVLTLSYMQVVYRGYFSDFSFTQAADKPWNWNYRAAFTVFSTLTDMALAKSMGENIKHNTNLLIRKDIGDILNEKKQTAEEKRAANIDDARSVENVD